MFGKEKSADCKQISAYIKNKDGGSSFDFENLKDKPPS